jgi:WD40 repeat protein
LLAIALSGCSSEPQVVTQGPRIIATLERTWQLGDGPGRQVTFSRDGALLASADATGEVVVRRTSDWRPESSLRHDGGATAVAFAPGNRLLTAGYDGVLRTWDLGDARELKRYVGAGGPIWTIDVSPDGQLAAAASEDGIIRIWPLGGSSAPLILKGHQRNIWNVRFSSSGKQLASGSFDKTARIWDVGTGKLLRTLNGHEQAVVGLDLSNDGRTLVTGGDDSTIRLWRTADGTTLKRIDAGNHIYSVELSPDERWLATGGRARSGFGTFWHQLTGTGGDAEPAKLWRVSDMAVVATLPHPDDVVSVAFSPDGHWLVTSSEDGKARLWRLDVKPR